MEPADIATCSHPRIVPIDADWARCTTCGDNTFPLHPPALDERLEQDAEPKAKRKKGTSPTARTLAELRKRGWTAQVVERWNPHAHVRVDLFGVIDLVAIVPAAAVVNGYPSGAAILGIQATDNTNHSKHRDKILAEPRARAWVDSGGRLELWSWALQGARGKAKRWTLRVETYAEMVAASKADA